MALAPVDRRPSGANPSALRAGRRIPGRLPLAFWTSVLLVASACGRTGSSRSSGTAQTLPPFAAASGVTRAGGSGDPGRGRIVPLRPMTGDVEILSGDPEKAGEPFVMRIHELPGTRVPLHSHPVDENITVVQGTWFFAIGETWDRAALNALRPGDYAFAPKGSSMFGYCPDGAIVQIHGVGPFLIHWRHGARTLDDGRAAETFSFHKGERVVTSRGTGTIRQGYASGDIVQYEIEQEDGSRFMADAQELRRV